MPKFIIVSEDVTDETDSDARREDERIRRLQEKYDKLSQKFELATSLQKEKVENLKRELREAKRNRDRSSGTSSSPTPTDKLSTDSEFEAVSAGIGSGSGDEAALRSSSTAESERKTSESGCGNESSEEESWLESESASARSDYTYRYSSEICASGLQSGEERAASSSATQDAVLSSSSPFVSENVAFVTETSISFSSNSSCPSPSSSNYYDNYYSSKGTTLLVSDLMQPAAGTHTPPSRRTPIPLTFSRTFLIRMVGRRTRLTMPSIVSTTQAGFLRLTRRFPILESAPQSEATATTVRSC